MKLVVLCAAVGMLASALPVSAQVVVHERDNNVVVREHVDRGHHYGWERHHAECRTVRVRTHLPNGDVVVKTRRTC